MGSRVVAPPRSPDFLSFHRDFVQQRRAEVPPSQRLDGLVGVDTPDRPIAFFNHAGRMWGVDGDTHFEPLDLAASALLSDPGRDPFVLGETGTRWKLVLRDDLDALRVDRGARNAAYLYVYAPRTRS